MTAFGWVVVALCLCGGGSRGERDLMLGCVALVVRFRLKPAGCAARHILCCAQDEHVYVAMVEEDESDV